MMTLPSLREMLEAGVHFGHKTSRWHPAMEKFIFVAKAGVHVINLEKTAEQLDEALKFLGAAAADGKKIIFVGTKKQANEIVKNAAISCDMPYVNSRWLGGTITNFLVIKESARQFQKKKELLGSERLQDISKKEQTKLREEVEGGEKLFGGLVKLENRPDALILFGEHDEKNALKEARMVGIPIVAMVDTNANPLLVDYPVPANDDATKSIELFANLFAKVIRENKKAVAKEEDKK